MIFLSALLFSGLTVTLAPQSEVRGVEVRLGEVAEVRGDDAELVRRANEVSLGYAPSPGYRRVLPRWKIERLAETALADVDITVTGAEAVTVTPAVESVDAGRLERAAVRALEARFAGRDATWRLAEPLTPVLVPRGEQPLRIEAELANEPAHAGRWSVPLRLFVDGAPYRTVWASFEVELYERLPVLLADVPAGASLAPDIFTYRRVRLTGPIGPAVTPEMLEGARSARALPAGAVLTERDVRRAHAVKRGATVDLEVRRGSITARVRAVAGADGYLGDRIPVTVQTSGKTLSARVVARDVVRYEMGELQ